MAVKWNDFGTGMLGAGAAWYKGNQADKLGNAVVGSAEDMANRQNMAYNQYADKLASLQPMLSAGYTPRSAALNTGFASASVDPNTGTASYSLNPQSQGMFDALMRGAGTQLGKAGDFDPEAMAADRMAARQKLLAPARQAQQDKLMRDMAAKGLLGVTNYSQPGAQPGAGTNPYMGALAAANARVDDEYALKSLEEGQNYMDRLLNRSGGMLNMAGSLDAQGQKALGGATDFSKLFTNAAQGKTGQEMALMQKAFEAQRNATYDPTTALNTMQAKNAQAKADYNRKAGIADAVGQRGGMLDTALRGMGDKGALPGAISAATNLFAGAKDWFGGLFNNNSYANQNPVSAFSSFDYDSTDW